MTVRSLRGMRDILPAENRRWRTLEETVARLAEGFGYEEMQLPLLEATDLFARGVGDATDIVEKEMYTLQDRDGGSISLRPEGTASCLRALLQHGLLHNRTQRVFYRGPMFRHERPQKGRFRQFHQVGVEAFGLAGAELDAELLQLCQAFWNALGVADIVRLELNSLGSAAARDAWRSALVAWLEPRRSALDSDSVRRLTRNPLRILDSKAPETQALLTEAPKLRDYLDAESIAHDAALKALLDELGIHWVENPRLVRGLDYYNRTVFEWTSSVLGAQATVCAGGRYDGLAQMIGGKATPAAGFALGIERLLLLVAARAGEEAEQRGAVDLYCCLLPPATPASALAAAEQIRQAIPGLRVRVHHGGDKLANQLRRADQSGAQWAMLLGLPEVGENALALKDLRTGAPQRTLTLPQALDVLRQETAAWPNF